MSTEDTALEAALPALLAALPAALAALLAADPATSAALLAALPAALAALEALEARSLPASLAWEQLTANAVVRARPPATAATRVRVVFILRDSPFHCVARGRDALLERQRSKRTIAAVGSGTSRFPSV